MGQIIFERPAADLGAVEFEVVQAQGFGSGEAVRTGRQAGQPFGEQFDHGLGPTGGMIAARSAWGPEGILFSGAGGVVSGGQSVEAAAGETQLSARLGGVQSVLAEAFQHMADEGRRVTMNQLLVFFKDRQDTRKPVFRARLFVGHRYARPPQRRARKTGKVLFC